MAQCKEVDNKTLAGVEVLTLQQAIEKSEEEKFYLLYQSKVSKEVYGLLKPCYLEKKKGYCFIPIFINGDVVTL